MGVEHLYTGTHTMFVCTAAHTVSLCKHIINTSETGLQVAFHDCISTCLLSPGGEFITAELFCGVEIKQCAE